MIVTALSVGILICFLFWFEMGSLRQRDEAKKLRQRYHDKVCLYGTCECPDTVCRCGIMVGVCSCGKR